MIERVAIVGAGAMGGMYAAHLVDAGATVAVAARGERAARLARDGLIVNGSAVPVAVHDASGPPAAEPADLVIVAVKHHHLDAALDDVAPLVGPRSLFLSVLNGLDSEDRILARFADVLTDPGQVLLGMALGMDANRDAEGIHFGQTGVVVFGEAEASTSGEAEASTSGEHAGGAATGRVRAVQDLLDRTGLPWRTPDDMRHEMWWKFMINCGINQASAVLDATYGEFVDDGPPRHLMEALMLEVVEVAAAEGVTLTDADRERWDVILADQPVDGMTSMHQDVAAGRPTEVDIFAGHAVALAERHGIAVPFNSSMLQLLG